jgi:H+-transporting ATPase
MVTGDSLATARTVAAPVGVGDRAWPPEALRGDIAPQVEAYDVCARVFPEDKFHVVQALQRAGHIVGMTGDGVNDAPALQQAEVGIAVATATDVAKAAASLVLTTPGLREVLAAVATSRRISQRMRTYTLNTIIKTIEIAVFLSLGVMLTGVLVLTPLLIVLLLFTHDFVTMAIATDRVPFVRTPERWRMPTLLLTAGTLAVPLVLLSFSVFVVGRDLLHLPLAQVHTLIFVLLVCTGQGHVYLVRERRHCWQSLPSHWLLLSSGLDVVIVSVLATHGILMAAISPALVAGVFGVVLAFLLVVDVVKIRLLRYFDLEEAC